MADIYSISGDSTDINSYKKEDIGLFGLLKLNQVFMVDGVKFIQKNSSEWNAHIADFRERLKRAKQTPDEIEAAVAMYSNKDVLVLQTPFYSMHYQGKKLVCDKTLKLIGEISVQRKTIDIFRAPYYLADMSKKARHARSLAYDGNLRDALGEFQHERFTLSLFDISWHISHIEDGQRTIQLTKEIPIEGATLDDVFKFASQGS